MIIVATFYHFFDFADYEQRRDAILAEFNRLGIKGSLLTAAEGFNGTLSGTRDAIDAALAYLKKEITHEEFEHKESICDEQPFARAKVRLKKETISIGEPVKREFVGEYVESKDWNDLIGDPDTVLLDARNAYETRLGTFKGSIDPDTRIFKELPEFVRTELADKKDKKIATFCTGGIRCEKLTAWMKQEGFEKVYHLKGGILQYLEDIPKEQSTWEGECFVFDERIAVDHELQPSQIDNVICPCCGLPVTPEDQQRDDYIEGVSCRFCFEHKKPT